MNIQLMTYFSKVRCGILVNLRYSEDGPKNPFKGISMKFLVLACDAPLWAETGS